MKVCQLLFTLFILLGSSQYSQAQCPFDFFVNSETLGCDVNCTEVFVDVSGNTGPYLFSIDGGQTFQQDPVFFICQPGVYLMLVQDANGDICEQSFTVDFFDMPIGVIDGLDCLIPGQTAQLFAIASGGVPPYEYQWSDGSTGVTTVVTDAGTWCVTITDSFGCFSTVCYDVETGGFIPIIEVVAGAVCMNVDSLAGGCQRVCSNTTVTYQVSNANGADVDWTIDGSDDFEVNDDQVTITWGEAGFGEVTATVGDPGIDSIPASIYCGQFTETDPDQFFAEGYVFIDGGQGPFQVDLNGSVIGMGNGGLTIFPELQPGTYFVSVLDALGQSYSCSFFINDGGCYLNAYAQTIPSSSPNGCNGGVNLTVVGGFEPGFQWTGANGLFSQEEDLFGVCCGTYNVFIEDFAQNCDSIGLTVNVPCQPQSCGGETSICVEILEDPQSIFSTNPPASGGVVDVCKGQPVEFFNQSIGASTFIWDFGDFTNSVLENPIHTYPQAGQYEVSLIARNDCFCADTSTIIINVSDLEIPEIECVGTVCKGETVTYSTPDECASYSWTITGDATIIEGGTPSDNFITIEWNQGPEGTIELSVANCNPALCDAAAIASIPIITDDISLIEGPDKVCPNDISTYSITDFGGSEFTWTVSGGNILEGQGTNQISVEWIGSPLQNPHSVSINYENCFLNCGGSDQMDVNIRSEFYVAGPIEVCQNQSGTYDAIDAGFDVGVNVNWDLLDNTGASVFTASGSQTSINFSLPLGNYTLQATPQNASGTCTVLYEIMIEVTDLPPPPNAIIGTDLICPGTAYTYNADGLPAHEFHWIINNGGIITEDFGDQLNVIWGANPPYELQLSQISVVGLQCESETISFAATAIQTFTVSGTEGLCREEIGFYTADNFENVNYEWTITPETAGTIIDGENTDNIEIFWHSAGNHTVSIDICGLVQTVNVEVFELPEPVVDHPALLCPFEEGVVSTTVGYDAYEWRNESGAVISNDPNPSLIPGYYEVVVTDANGCTGNDIFQIEGLPQPNISISTPGILGLCPPSSITLFAIETTGGYSYQWYQDDVPVGTDVSSLQITDAATYYTIITDANGCTAQSNSLTFIDCEDLGGTCINGLCIVSGGGGPGPGCTPVTNVDFTFNTTGECNVIDFQNTSSNYVLGSEQWIFRDVDSGPLNTSNLMNPSHLFTRPGFFRVRLTVQGLDANGAPCGFRWTEKVVLVPAAADFRTAQGCVGSPVQFSDHSAFLPDEITGITNWEWNFGDPASGANNTSTDQNPTHIFPDDTDYQVTLTITTVEGCTSTVTKTVSVNKPPAITFTPPTINCQNTSMEFILDYPSGNENNIVEVEWNFDDAASGDANTSIKETSYHIYDTPGIYDVSVTAMNIFGCTATFTAQVTVEPNNLTGTISPANPSPICEGDNIELTVPVGGTFWNWSTGETSESITVDEEGVYSVTITNDEGCTYTPPAVLVEIIPAPVGTIRVVEYNEFGQPTAFFDDGYEVCEGEDVFLFAQTSADYAFQWTDGEDTQEISFTDDKGNLLSTGTHNFEVTITNTTTGCTAIAGPFEVIINPTPNDVTISSNPSGPLCDGTAATLSVDNPDGALIYVWNTGEQGTSINVFAAGEYFVRAINSFGCEGESNRISIENAPNINAVPSGCHVSCLPDTLCLPNIPGVVSYQWFQDGVAIPAPQGTVADLIIDESGSYTVVMTDAFGCTAESDPINMELFPGFGNILGEVYFDVNANGVIDAGDTLVSNMEIILIDNGMFLDTAVTLATGIYGFPNIVSGNNYTLLFNTDLLPPTWNVYTVSQNASLNGCDDEQIVNFLLFEDCLSPPSAIEIGACTGTQVEYEGVLLDIGDTQDFTLENQFLCDSVVTVTITENEISAELVELSACEGATAEYEGLQLAAGSTQDFVLVNYLGCDSIITVEVAENQVSIASLQLHACEGSTVEYQGMQLTAGSTQDFVLVNYLGCDSTITVDVEEVFASETMVDLTACQDETVTFMGQEVAAGTTQEFQMTDQYGCDSTVVLTVDMYPEITFSLDAEEICFNATDGAIEVINVVGGATGIEYSLDGLNYQADALFEGLTAGIYDVYVRDDNGCIYEDVIEMPIIPALQIQAENGIIDCEEDGVELQAMVLNANPNDLTWSWSNGSDKPTTFAESAGVFEYNVTNQCQTETGQVEVDWAMDGRVQFFHFPNAFSPNDDGANDRFYAQTEAAIEVLDFKLEVYDRWGNLRFQTDDPMEQWDGQFNGQVSRPGVYIVLLESTIVACGREIRQKLEGDVIVVQ